MKRCGARAGEGVAAWMRENNWQGRRGDGIDNAVGGNARGAVLLSGDVAVQFFGA